MTPRFDISPAEMIFDPSNTMYAMASVLGAVHSVGRSLMLLRGGEFAAFAAQTCARDLSAEVAVHIPDAAQADSVAARIRSTDEHLVLSRSVHNLEAAVRAEGEGADMLVLGTVFPSTSHPGGPTIGPEGVRKVCSAVSIPVIGIGGITAENASEVMAAGAGGVAVISAIFDAPDPAAAASALRHAVGALSPSPVLGEGAGG